MDTPITDQSYVVRYGTTRILGEFSARGLGGIPRGTAVIIRGERGHEWGVVLSTATQQTRTYLGSSDEHGRIIRVATAEDEANRDKAIAFEQEAFASGLDQIRERKLQMQLIDVEQVIGGERLVYYYVAEQRIDFRELVKALAKQFQTRIEMRQIGIRDEAKLLADYGDCGQPVCCNTFLREMPPVSMKMAKQKATLDPNKISGRCGRLKCCLRYEYDTYEENRKELLPVGATVVTKQGTGKIIGQELLSRKLMIAYEGHSNVMTDEKDIVTVISTKSTKPNTPPKERDADDSGKDAPRHEGQPRPDRPRGEPPRGEQRPDDRPRGDHNRQNGGRGPRSGPDRPSGPRDDRDQPPSNPSIGDPSSPEH